MKPRIVLVHRPGSLSFANSLDVYSSGKIICSATDIDYESDAASKCCELLAAMHKKGLIELYADPSAFALWNESLADCELVEDPKDAQKIPR